MMENREMNPETLGNLIASDGANALMTLLVARFLETKGLISVAELMTFLEQAAAELSEGDGAVPELARALRQHLAVLGRIGTAGRVH
jgi:hypothetical protein